MKKLSIVFVLMATLPLLLSGYRQAATQQTQTAIASTRQNLFQMEVDTRLGSLQFRVGRVKPQH